MTTVYFATNRAADPGCPGGYGAALSPVTTYAVADVEGIDLANADAGKIASISDVNEGDGEWNGGTLDAILAAGKPLLVFIHGFDNSFKDALARAAYLAEMYKARGTDVTMLAFTWPSAGKLLDLSLNPADAYLQDQGRAAGSARAIAEFFGLLEGIRSIPNTGLSMTLLCHSMGNYALAEALNAYAPSKEELLFDAVILAAADERFDSFSLPDGSRLGHLADIAARTTVYHASCDAALGISHIVNGIDRLGRVGPPGSFNHPAIRVVDCSAVDQDPLFDPDKSHQYYRWQADVEADAAAVILGKELAAVLFDAERAVA